MNFFYKEYKSKKKKKRNFFLGWGGGGGGVEGLELVNFFTKNPNLQ